jgi:D-alanyl-lipoteichoic acid acyltransferase DltB (MBOAT superfamily)
MTFTEKPFLVLLLATYALWLLCRGHDRLKVLVLLAASLTFYAYHAWPLVFLILAYCLVDWAAGLWIGRSRRPWLPLTLGVTFNLAGLAYWKYTPLLLRTAAGLVRVFPLAGASGLSLGVPDLPDHWQIPLGISFYTFTGIAYMVDVYRRTTPVETDFLRFTLYKTFFPQLVAGPILRPRDFLVWLQPGTMPDRPQEPLEATMLLARGFFKKMVLADRIALAIDPFFHHVADGSTAGVWSLPYVYLYALQICFDFSGYTDIARGLGLLFGFRWPENFNLPYLAGSVQEFWHRWHITLSQFLRDYLYIPLGGSRKGEGRTYVNLMLTMLLGGLWHGASWSFLLWGGLHGLYLVLFKLWGRCPLRDRLRSATGVAGGLWRAACVVATFHCVCLAWCFFRLTVWRHSLICVQKWVVFDADKCFVGGSGDLSLWLVLALYGLLVLAVHGCRRLPALAELREHPERLPLAHGFAWGLGVGLLALAVLLSPGGEAPPFIYFQF